MFFAWFHQHHKISQPITAHSHLGDLGQNSLSQLEVTWSSMFWGGHFQQDGYSLPETNRAPEIRQSQKETIVFQLSIFRCEMLVSGRVISSCVSWISRATDSFLRTTLGPFPLNVPGSGFCLVSLWLPETNLFAPENRPRAPKPETTVLFQPSPCSGASC